MLEETQRVQSKVKRVEQKFESQFALGHLSGQDTALELDSEGTLGHLRESTQVEVQAEGT